jgi:hypothetical protein
MRLAGVDSASGTCSPSFAISVPRPWRQAIAALRSCARALSMRRILQILAGGVGAEHEFRGPRPVAEILRQRRGAGHIGLAARGVVDGAVGAHQGGEKFLGFAGPRVAAADPDFLARRRRRDIEPGAARQLDHRVGVGIVHPARAAIERHLECRGVGEAAAADLAAASTTITLRFAAWIRRAAAMPATPAPITTMSASRGNGAPDARPPSTGVAARPRTPRESRGASLSCHGFRTLKKT